MAPLTALIKRVWASTFLICAGFLVAFNCSINEINPLKLDKFDKMKTLWGTQVAKIPSILASSENADVLIVGASGVLVPSVRCDDAYYGRRTRYDAVYMAQSIWSYSRSDFFQHELSKGFGKQLDLINAAVGGCMESDQYLILRRYLASGKRPKLILLFTGPKDFIDNWRPDVTTTAIYTLLADYPTRISDIMQNNVAFGPAFQSLSDTALKAVCTYYNARSDYRDYLTDVAARVTGHPKSVGIALPQQKKVETKFANRNDIKPQFSQSKERKDLANFRITYRPGDTQQFNMQSKFMDKIVALAAQENIPITITLMPLTPEHIGVLGSDRFANYKRTVRSIAQRWHVACFDPASEITFDGSDFEDSAHLSTQGGKKFFACLTDDLLKERTITASLDDRRSLIGQH